MSSDIRTQRVSTLDELNRVIASTLESDEVLRRVIEAAVEITGATSGSLLLIDPEDDTLSIRVAFGYTEDAIRNIRLRVGEGVTGWVAGHNTPLLVPDVTTEERYVNVDESIRSELAVPLIVEGETLGVVNVNSARAGAFTQADLELLIMLTSQSAQVIRNARLFDTVRQRAEELGALFTVGKSIAGTLNLERVLSQVVEEAARLMNTQICSLMLLSEDGRELIIEAVYGGSPDYTDRENLQVNETLIGKVIRAKRPLTVMDVREEEGYRHPDLASREGLCSLLSVPMIARGRAIGVLNTYKSTRHRFAESEIQLLSSMADLAAIAIENARLYEQMMVLEERIRRIEKLGVLGELAVGVAHEIRNPLTIIKMLVHGLRSEYAENQDMGIIGSEIVRLNGIVNRFLNYARPAESVSQEVDLNGLLDDTVQLVGHRIERQRIEVERRYEALPSVQADPDKIEQVLLNLLLNALDAMPEGGGLMLTTHTADTNVAVRIQDTGPGIPAEIRDRLFQPFVTTKPDGLGLGLSIVRRLADEHHGEVRVETDEGTGTAFILRLPIGR